MEEVLGFFPHMEQDTLGIRQTVRRQLHDERNRIALEDGALQQKTRQDGDHDAQNVQGNHDQRSMLREEGGGNHAVDWQLGTARHEWGQNNGHLAVTVAGKGSGCHNGRNAASEANQHRNEGASGQSDFSQQLVHDKGNTRHIAAVLKQGQEEKQQDDDGQEGENASNTGADTVDDQGNQPRGHLCVGHHLFETCGEAVDASAEQILQRSADDREGQPENGHHNEEEDWDSQILVGQESVNLFRAQLFAGFLMLDNALRAQRLDVGVAHIGKSRFSVGAEVLLHLLHDMVDDVNIAGVQIQRVEHRLIALDQLGCSEANRVSGSLAVVLDDVCNRVDCAVNLTLAEIELLGRGLIPNRFQH